MDAVGRKVYWADPDLGQVLSASLDGSNIETILGATDGLEYAHHIAIHLAPGGGSDALYISHEVTNEIFESSLAGANLSVFTAEPVHPTGVWVGPFDEPIFADGFEGGHTLWWSAVATPGSVCPDSNVLDDMEDGDLGICHHPDRFGVWYTFDDGPDPQPYGLSGFDEVSLWARAVSPMTVRLAVPTLATDPLGGTCTDCFDHCGTYLSLTSS